MKRKPIIGIIAKPEYSQIINKSVWLNDYIKDEFRDVVFNLGGIAIGILPSFYYPKYNIDESIVTQHNNLSQNELNDLKKVLKLCDGFILQGGLSGDYYEYYIAKYSIQNNIPILGICAGFNSLVRAAGCELSTEQELHLLPSLHNVYSKSYRHSVKIINDTILFEIFKTNQLLVNSIHSKFLTEKAAKENNDNIVINATVTDTLDNGFTLTTVEAVSVKNTRFALGIKWHPEIMDQKHKQLLFKRFLDECQDLINKG